MPDQDARRLRRRQQRDQKKAQVSDLVSLTRWDASAGGWVATGSNGQEQLLGELSNGAVALGQIVPKKGRGFKVLPFVPQPQPLPGLLPNVADPTTGQVFVLFAREFDISGTSNDEPFEDSQRGVNLWSDKRFASSQFVSGVSAKGTLGIAFEQPTTDPPQPPLTWVESTHPEDGRLKPIFNYSPNGQSLALTGFVQPVNESAQGPFISAPPGGISWEVELSADINPSSNEDWLFFLTGSVDQVGHTLPTEARNDIRVEMDVSIHTAEGNRVQNVVFWNFDWRVQKETFEPNIEASVTTADPASIEFFPAWDRDQDLHQQTLNNGDPSPVWETVDGQNILFQYFGFGRTFKPDVSLTPQTNGRYYRFRIRFEGNYRAGTATFNDFKINFAKVPGPSRYYLGAGVESPYVMSLQTAPPDGRIIYREWDDNEETGATDLNGTIVSFTTEDAQRRGFLTPINPLTYDWRAPYEFNFDLEIDYTDTTAIPDPYLRQILPNKGANLVNGKVYICDLNQIVDSPELGQVSLKDAMELPVGLQSAPQFVRAVVDEYEDQVATGKTYTVALPTLVTAGIFSSTPQNTSGVRWWSSFLTYTNIEHEVLAIAFVPPE